MANTKDDLDFDKRNNYRLEGGQDTPFGRLNFRVLTQKGGGFGFYDNGESGEDIQVGITGKSVEVVGAKLNKSDTATEDPIYPAKWIKAKNGDIVLDAENGNIILKGDNVLIEANGLRNDQNGDVLIIANKGIRLTGADIKIDGTQVTITAKKDFSIIGKTYGEIVAGLLNMTSAADFGGSSLLTQISSIAKNFLGA